MLSREGQQDFVNHRHVLWGQPFRLEGLQKRLAQITADIPEK
jgi:hypothetical protein